MIYIFILLVTFNVFAHANADDINQECIDKMKNGSILCANALYENLVKFANDPQKLCSAIFDTYITCLTNAFSCSSSLDDIFRKQMGEITKPLNEIKNLCKDKRNARKIGTMLWSLAFGDPHYRMKDGTIVTCNKPGEHTYASSMNWVVKVNHKPVGDNKKGAVIDKVVVEIETFLIDKFTVEYNLAGFVVDRTVDEGSISITATGIESRELGLMLKVERSPDALAVGIITDVATNGIFIKGCPDEETIPSSAIPDSCKALDPKLQAACAFDSTEMNEAWAVKAGTAAQATAAKMEEEAKKINGIAHYGILYAALVLITIGAAI